MEQDPTHRSRDVDNRLVGFHLDQWAVLGDGLADRHVPVHDHRLGEAFTDVGEVEFGRHQASIVSRAAAAIRSTVGT